MKDKIITELASALFKANKDEHPDDYWANSYEDLPNKVEGRQFWDRLAKQCISLTEYALKEAHLNGN